VFCKFIFCARYLSARIQTFGRRVAIAANPVIEDRMARTNRAEKRVDRLTFELRPEDDLVGRGMAQWRRERPDIDCSGKAVVGRILRLQDVIVRAVDAQLRPFGLRYPAYAVLATIRVSGAPFRMSPTQLRATLLLTSGGLSNLLGRLERRGLVRRFADPHDGRGVIVELTEKGRALADEAMPAHAAVERRLLRMFDPAERSTLADLLSRMMVLNGHGLAQ
jgi:DNA-binding MarR family transcriptional regulator